LSFVESNRNPKPFRLLLLIGAVISFGTALPAMFAVGILKSSLGLQVAAGSPGFTALARLYGGIVFAVGVGFLLAAIDPIRHRGLLIVLFLVPLSDLLFTVAGVATNEISRPKGAVFAALDLAYCLLYFRLFPRADEPAPRDEDPVR
jgi:hypothetical protein